MSKDVAKLEIKNDKLLAQNKQLTLENNNILGLSKIKQIVSKFDNLNFDNEVINDRMEKVDTKIRNLRELFMKMLKCILDEAE